MARTLKTTKPPARVVLADVRVAARQTESTRTPVRETNRGMAPDRPEEVERVSDPSEEAYRRGVEEGREAAMAELGQDMKEQIEAEQLRIGTMLVGVQEQLDKLERRLEITTVRLAIAIAEQIVRREVKADPETVLRQIREALRRVIGVERVRLRVHPQDAPVVRQQQSAIAASADAVRDIDIEADESVQPGGVILESDAGNVDGRITTQLQRIEAVLMEEGASS